MPPWRSSYPPLGVEPSLCNPNRPWPIHALFGERSPLLTGTEVWPFTHSTFTMEFLHAGQLSEKERFLLTWIKAPNPHSFLTTEDGVARCGSYNVNAGPHSISCWIITSTWSSYCAFLSSISLPPSPPKVQSTEHFITQNLFNQGHSPKSWLTQLDLKAWFVTWYHPLWYSSDGFTGRVFCF